MLAPPQPPRAPETSAGYADYLKAYDNYVTLYDLYVDAVMSQSPPVEQSLPLSTTTPQSIVPPRPKPKGKKNPPKCCGHCGLELPTRNQLFAHLAAHHSYERKTTLNRPSKDRSVIFRRHVDPIYADLPPPPPEELEDPFFVVTSDDAKKVFSELVLATGELPADFEYDIYKTMIIEGGLGELPPPPDVYVTGDEREKEDRHPYYIERLISDRAAEAQMKVAQFEDEEEDEAFDVSKLLSGMTFSKNFDQKRLRNLDGDWRSQAKPLTPSPPKTPVEQTSPTSRPWRLPPVKPQSRPDESDLFYSDEEANDDLEFSIQPIARVPQRFESENLFSVLS